MKGKKEDNSNKWIYKNNLKFMNHLYYEQICNSKSYRNHGGYL